MQEQSDNITEQKTKSAKNRAQNNKIKSLDADGEIRRTYK